MEKELIGETICPGHTTKARAAFEHVFVCALCHHPTTLQLDNGVTTPDGGESVGNEENGYVPAKTFYRVHHRLLSGVIERTGSLVKDEHIGLFVKCASDANPLTLATAQANTALPHHGAVAVLPTFDKIRNLGLARGLLYPFYINSATRHAEGNVFSKCGVGQKDALWNVGDGSLPFPDSVAADGLTIDQ